MGGLGGVVSWEGGWEVGWSGDYTELHICFFLQSLLGLRQEIQKYQ